MARLQIVTMPRDRLVPQQKCFQLSFESFMSVYWTLVVDLYIVLTQLDYNKKLSCRTETARRLNILLSHSRSFKVIRN